MALSPEQLQMWRNDATFGSSWRYDSAVAEDYYDGNQFDAETARKMEERGMPLTVANLCRDLVQTIVGLHERNQSDWIVRPEASDDHEELAQVLSLRLKEAESRTSADRTWLDATLSQSRAGIGWIEVGRSESLLDYPYRTGLVDWREMWWDPRAKSPNIVGDAEYLRRVKFFQRSQIEKRYPKKVAALRMAGPGDQSTGWYEPQQYQREGGWNDMTMVSRDLWGAGRDLLALEEIYYRTETAGYAVLLPNGRWVKFDQKDPMHIRAYESGLIEPKPTLVKRMNRAVYVGDICLVDGPSPYPHDEFPYIPVVYDREGRTGSPYGLIRVIMSLQDQVNTRLARAMWGLNQKQAIYDADAVTDPDMLREEMSRPDGMIELNPARKPGSKLEIKTDFQLSREQMGIYTDMMTLMPQLAGVPRSLSGQRESGITSGVAMNTMVEQGMNSQSRPSGMARDARTAMGRQLLALIIEDIGSKPGEVKAKKEGGKRIVVPVNVREQHPDGYEFIKNNIKQVQLQVTLDDVPSTPTHRMQQFQEVARSIQTIGDERLRSAALPILIEMSEMPHKHDMAKMIRKQMGMQEPDDMTPEEQQSAQKQAEIAEMMEQLQIALAEAKAAKESGEAAKAQAEAQHEEVKAAQTAAETIKTKAETVEIEQTVATNAVIPPAASPERQPEYLW